MGPRMPSVYLPQHDQGDTYKGPSTDSHWAPPIDVGTYFISDFTMNFSHYLLVITYKFNLHIYSDLAYSRMVVAHPIKREMEAVRVAFPLFKMWQTLLSIHPHSTLMHEVRKLLDMADGNQDVMNFFPYIMIFSSKFKFLALNKY